MIKVCNPDDIYQVGGEVQDSAFHGRWHFSSGNRSSSLRLLVMKAPGQEYTDFDGSLQELAELWMELGAEFRRKLKELRGVEL